MLRSAKLTIYADDTTLYASAQTLVELTSILNEQLERIEKLILENKLILNTSKTKSIVFGSNYSLRSKPELKWYINKTLIQQVKEVKLLGITLDNKVSWSKHIENTVKKMRRAVAVVRRWRQYFTFYIISFFSQLDYCQIIWANASKKDLRKLQLVQNKAARLILRCPYRTNINRMHFDLKWLKVEDRMIAAILLSTWKVVIF